MKKIAIVGSGGFAREVLTWIENINEKQQIYDILGFVGPSDGHTMVHGYPIIGNDDDVNATNQEISLVIAVGEPRMKERIRNKYNNPLISFPTLIHPSVIMGDSKTIKIGEGSVLCAGCVLTTDIQIGCFTTFNLMCTVGHDTVVGDFASFMPSVNISGEVVVNKGVYVGTGAKIINQVEIGANTIVGAGAVVVKTLPSDCTAVGMPAKPIKIHEK